MCCVCVCGRLSGKQHQLLLRFTIKVVRQHYSGEMGEFIIFLCEISSGFCTPQITEIDSVLRDIKNIKRGRFLRHSVQQYVLQ